MSEKNRDNIIELIQGLLAKTAERGATQAEAELAAAKVQELLAKYNLSMVEVEPVDAGGSLVEELTTYSPGGVGKRWLTTLAGIVGRAGFCHTIITSPTWLDVKEGGVREDAQGFIYIGREHNVKACAELLKWLEHAIWAIAKEDRRKLHLSGSRMTSFLMGIVSTIEVRLNEQRDAQEAQEVSLRALVVRHDEDNREYEDEHYPHLRRMRASRPSDYDAYTRGQAAGGRVPLIPQSRQVKGGN